MLAPAVCWQFDSGAPVDSLWTRRWTRRRDAIGERSRGCVGERRLGRDHEPKLNHRRLGLERTERNWNKPLIRVPGESRPRRALDSVVIIIRDVRRRRLNDAAKR
jgi:hypothetical protein